MSLIDPITRQVIRNAARAAAREMQAIVVKTAHSPLIYEVQDFGVVMTDRRGRLVAEGAALAGFLACLPPSIQKGIEIYGEGGFREGDVLLANEPYDTGTHISDTVVYMPVFVDGKLAAFTSVMAHWADIGGYAPGGWCPTTTDIHQEGLMFPHTKLYDAGVHNTQLHKFIMRNVRHPSAVEGDLNALIAACRTGGKRFQELCNRYGTDVVESALDDGMERSEARMREEIRAMPDGVYTAESYLDDDGVTLGKPVKIVVTVTIEGERITIDWTGSDPATAGPVNHPLVGTRAICGTVLKYLTMPNDPTNDGHLRVLDVIAPRNTIVSAEYPSPCDSYGYAAELVIATLIRAFADAIPERCPAATYQLFGFKLSRTNDQFGVPFIYGEPLDGGGGAMPHSDGVDGIMFVGNGDAPNVPVEVVEARYPVLINQYSIRSDNIGVGKFRGGHGIIREYTMLEDGIRLSLSIENNQYRLWGLFGGGDVGDSKVEINFKDGRQKVVDARIADIPLSKGDSFKLLSPNGGGWGEPAERAIEDIARDLDEGLLDHDKAAAIYGADRAKAAAAALAE